MTWQQPIHASGIALPLPAPSASRFQSRSRSWLISPLRGSISISFPIFTFGLLPQGTRYELATEALQQHLLTPGGIAQDAACYLRPPELDARDNPGIRFAGLDPCDFPELPVQLRAGGGMAVSMLRTFAASPLSSIATSIPTAAFFSTCTLACLSIRLDLALSLSAPKCCSATINSPDDGYFAARDSNVGFRPTGSAKRAGCPVMPQRSGPVCCSNRLNRESESGGRCCFCLAASRSRLPYLGRTRFCRLRLGQSAHHQFRIM
jgi:hypothetical protein